MSRGARLLPNVAAEEGPRWRDHLGEPRVRAVVALWSGLFGRGTEVIGAPELAADWPDALGPRADAPVFPWLEDAGGRVPWLTPREPDADAPAQAEAAAGAQADVGARPRADADPRAHAGAERRGDASSPRVVWRVHDKAFALQTAEAQGFVPRSLRGLSHVLDPQLLADPDRSVGFIADCLAAWPDWARRRFTLKPRLGTSGRGRIAGSNGRADTAAIRGALPRLAQCGGAVLEPWLERREDLSTQLRVDDDGNVVVLGSLRTWNAPSGLYLGHRGGVDSRGRVFSESRWEEAAREAAAAVVAAAGAEGFRGVCGVDAFSFTAGSGPDAREELRAVVELNARFTTGTLALGWVRRALPAVRSAIGLEPGVRRAFLFGIGPPPGAGGWQTALERAGRGAVHLPLPMPAAPDAADAAQRASDPAKGLEPGLLFAHAGEDIDAALEGG